MPQRKSKAAKEKASKIGAEDSQGHAPLGPPPENFPVAAYTSVTGVHTTLLAFTALFLPRTPVSFITEAFPIARQAADDASGSLRRSALHLLTSNPARTVAWICAGTFVVQLWWAGWVRNWSFDLRRAAQNQGDAGQQTQDKLSRSQEKSQQLKTLWAASVTTLAASVAFYILIVLFGAPILSHTPHTYSLALLVALLTSFTPAYTLGPPSLRSDAKSLVTRLTWIRLFAELSPRTPIERALVYPAAGALLGCWSGAIPIGLDWERPWQAWPLTPAYGAVAGYILGSLAALVVSSIKHLAEADVRLHRADAQQRAKST
ncbi:hypothetical protein CERSUDRAFT_114862 [Gelatoporia subvermispora B]|uniref:PIG-F-domain-containing protein n=1 Tax=Ceriporiopsis subvermispora (strain B) TaxID=914234 RepID=M2QXU5_CERS8|nr:hypothetical protein CERSUDRAFT_114862 [Gelatoporia subvermispora B]